MRQGKDVEGAPQERQRKTERSEEGSAEKRQREAGRARERQREAEREEHTDTQQVGGRSSTQGEESVRVSVTLSPGQTSDNAKVLYHCLSP